jgi:hypothetical protein
VSNGRNWLEGAVARLAAALGAIRPASRAAAEGGAELQPRSCLTEVECRELELRVLISSWM